MKHNQQKKHRLWLGSMLVITLSMVSEAVAAGLEA